MIKWLERRFYLNSFRATFLVWSIAIQCVLVVLFTTILIWNVRNLGVNTLVDNLNASAAAYARSAELAFIVSSENERQEIISDAIVSSTNVGAMIMKTSGELVLAVYADGVVVSDELLNRIDVTDAPSILGDDRHQVFLHPVYLTRADQSELGVIVDNSMPELLGYYALIGSKSMVNELQQDMIAVAALGVALLLGFLLVINAGLAAFVLTPVERLVSETQLINASRAGMRVRTEGPVEVQVLADAMNELLARLEEVRAGLNEEVAEKTREERAQRKRAEEALDIAEEARKTAEKLRDNRAHIMTANTHDLLTPLRMIINLVERLQEHLEFMPASQSLDAAKEDTDRIKKHIGQIEDLVDDINESMRIETTPIQYEEKSLLRLSTDLRDTFEPEALSNGNTLTLTIEEKTAVLTDHRKLGAICRNLLSNACKFTRDGTIDFSIRVEAAQLQIRCQDTGVGIDEDMVALIYDRFQRGDLSSTRIADGLGLGLTIVRGSVERLGGEIRCDSTRGVGTTFKVNLPLGEVAIAADAEQANR